MSAIEIPDQGSASQPSVSRETFALWPSAMEITPHEKDYCWTTEVDSCGTTSSGVIAGAAC
ncbi:MAG TPA: hypothetical protein VIW24_14660, partial [Aldersonia sp.]